MPTGGFIWPAMAKTAQYLNTGQTMRVPEVAATLRLTNGTEFTLSLPALPLDDRFRLLVTPKAQPDDLVLLLTQANTTHRTLAEQNNPELDHWDFETTIRRRASYTAKAARLPSHPNENAT